MAEKIVTTEELMKQSQGKSFSTEELFGKSLPTVENPSLPTYIKYKLTMDKANAVRSSYGSEAMWGKRDTQEALKLGNKERDYWVKKAGPYDDFDFKEAPVKFVIGEAAQLLPYMISSQIEGLKYGMTIGGGFALTAAIAGQAGPQAAFPEEIVTVPGAFAVGMKTGYAYGVIKHTLDREGGGLYLDMVEKGISEDTARTLALAGGTLIGAIELLQFKTLSKPFRMAFSKVAGTKVGKQAISAVVGRYAQTVGKEVGQEELQEITALVTETLAGVIEENPGATPTREEWVNRLYETFTRSLAGMGVIALPGAGVDVATVKRRGADAVILEKAIVEADEVKKMISPAKAKPAPEPTAGIKGEEIKEPSEAKIPLTRKELLRLDELEHFYGYTEKERVELGELEDRYEKVGVTVEVEDFVKKMKEIKERFRRPETIAKKEVKLVQEEIIKGLQDSELDAKDKSKFIASIKNIQTAEQLNRVLPEIKQRIERLETAATKRDVTEKIKKELKYTKPVKVGQKKVAKFDYERSKVFDEIRGYDKLTQTKAQEALDKIPEEPTNEIDLIKARFLSLKANGTSASAQIYEQVLADIKNMKKLGKEAKDATSFEKAVYQEARVDDALASIDKITGTAKSIKTKIVNAYRKGFSNTYSMLNSIGGKKFAETYDPELRENKRNTAIYQRTVEMTENAAEIYGENNIMRLFETMARMDYTITDVKDGLTTELSKLELIDIYNSIKNGKKKQDYYGTFGKEQIDRLLGSLTESDKAFGDSMQETVQGYREIINQRNIETTGRDIGFVENYWPGSSEFQVSVTDDMRVQGETPKAARERAKTPVIPIPRNAWYKAQKHIGQGEHVANLSREYETLKRLFNDRKVKHAITQKFGEDVYNTVLDQIENISLNKQSARIDSISSTFQKAINNWVTAKIAFNPSTFVRQLTSVGNYAEQMHAGKWTTGFWKGITHPKATFDYMWKNNPWLEARFNKGYSEALSEAIKGAESISVNKKVWTRMLTSLVRGGDIAAIIYGGYPLMLEKGASAFESATLKAQQSGLSSSISQFQNSKNPFTRLFLAFKNTSNQYFRKMVDAAISRQNGDISREQFAKTMAIYAVIQPILYVSAGFATKTAFSALGRALGRPDYDPEEEKEKFLNEIMIQMIVSPVNAIPIINDVVRTAARKLTGQKIYQVFSLPLLDDLERGFRALSKEEVSGVDYFKTMTTILEMATASPIGTAIRYYELLMGKIGKAGKVKFK